MGAHLPLPHPQLTEPALLTPGDTLNACTTHNWTQIDESTWAEPGKTIYACETCEETTPACVQCQNPVGTALLICERCIQRERWVLHDIDAMLDQYQPDPVSLHSRPRYDLTNTKGGTSGEHLTPDDIRARLQWWVALWAKALDEQPSNGDPTEYLRSRIIWAAQNQSLSHWPQFRDATRKTRGHARLIAGLAADKYPRKCAYCGGVLVQDRTDKQGQALPTGRTDAIRCTGCGENWPDEQSWKRLQRYQITMLPDQHPDALVTLEEARVIYRHIPSTTWRDWLRRDRERHRRSVERSDTWQDQRDAFEQSGQIGPWTEPPTIAERALPERGYRDANTPLYRLGDLHAKVVNYHDDTRPGPKAKITTM